MSTKARDFHKEQHLKKMNSLRSKLYHGDMSRIAAACGVSREEVSMCFAGKLFKKSLLVEAAAKIIIEKRQKEISQKKENYKKIL